MKAVILASAQINLQKLHRDLLRCVSKDMRKITYGKLKESIRNLAIPLCFDAVPPEVLRFLKSSDP